MLGQCRKRLHGANYMTGELIYHVKDYPALEDRGGSMPYGSVPDYCWGDYHITEHGDLLRADCVIRADKLLIIGPYSLLVDPCSRLWYMHATGQTNGNYLPRNYWLGSTPPFGHNCTSVPPTLIYPSKVRKLLAPLMKCDGPARLAAEYVLADMDAWDGMLIYELENRRHDGSFWGLKHVMI